MQQLDTLADVQIVELFVIVRVLKLRVQFEGEVLGVDRHQIQIEQGMDIGSEQQTVADTVVLHYRMW